MTDLKTHSGGEQSAERTIFREQVQQYQRSIFGFLCRFGFRPDIVEELAQDTFLRAWRARHTADPVKGAYSTWLFRIARNVALNEIARSKIRIDEYTDDAIDWAPSNETAEAEAISNETMAQLKTALAQLNDQEREAIALACVRELTMHDAAKVAGCTEGAFRTRLSRARKRLLEHWNNNE